MSQQIAFTQIVGEIVAYEQDVSGDVISAAAWDSNPPGIIFSNQQFTDGTATSFISSDSVGEFIVTCTVDMVSGQRRKGQAIISVVENEV